MNMNTVSDQSSLDPSLTKDYFIALNKAQSLIEFDMNGMILTANDNMLNVLGYSLAEIQGKHHSIFVEQSYRESADYKLFWEKLNCGEAHSAEYKRVGKNKNSIWLQASYNPVVDADNKLVKVIKFAIDITEQKELIENTRIEMQEAIANLDSQNLLKTRLSELFNALRGELNVEALASILLSKLSTIIRVHLGAFYLLKNTKLELIATYAYKVRKNLSNTFEIGEGLIGQCAREKKVIVIKDIPDNYVKVSSGLGESSPRMLMVVPIIFEHKLLGVMEIGTLDTFTDADVIFLEQSIETIAITINSANARVELKTLLEEAQAQREELEEKNQEQQRIQEMVKIQTEELRTANEELEDKNRSFELQQKMLEDQRHNIEVAEQNLAKREKELALKANS